MYGGYGNGAYNNGAPGGQGNQAGYQQQGSVSPNGFNSFQQSGGLNGSAQNNNQGYNQYSGFPSQQPQSFMSPSYGDRGGYGYSTDSQRANSQLNEVNSRIATLQAQLSSEESARVALEQERAHLLRELETAKSQLFASLGEREEASRTARERQPEIDRLLDKLEEETALRVRLQALVDELRAQREEYETEFGPLRDRLKDVEQVLQETVVEKDNLAAELVAINRALKEKSAEVEIMARFEKEYDSKVKAVLSDQENKIDSLEAALKQTGTNGEVKELHELLRTREAEIDALEARLYRVGSTQPNTQPSSTMSAVIADYEKKVNSLKSEQNSKDVEIANLREKLSEFSAGFSDQEALRKISALEQVLANRTAELSAAKIDLGRFLSDSEQIFQENSFLRRTAGIPEGQLLDIGQISLAQKTGAASKLKEYENLEREWEAERTRLRRRVLELSSLAGDKSETSPRGVQDDLKNPNELQRALEENRKLLDKINSAPDTAKIATLEAENQALKYSLADKFSKQFVKGGDDFESAKVVNGRANSIPQGVPLSVATRSREVSPEKRNYREISDTPAPTPPVKTSLPIAANPRLSIAALPSLPGMPLAAYSPLLNSAVCVPRELKASEKTVAVLTARLAEAIEDARSARLRETRVRAELAQSVEALDLAAAKYAALLDTVNQSKDVGKQSVPEPSSSSGAISNLADRTKLPPAERIAIAEGNEVRLAAELKFARDEFSVLKRSFEGLESDTLQREAFLRRRNFQLAEWRDRAVHAVEKATCKLENVVGKEKFDESEKKLQAAIAKVRAMERVIGEASDMQEVQAIRECNFLRKRLAAVEGNFAEAQAQLANFEKKIPETKIAVASSPPFAVSQSEIISLATKQTEELRRILARKTVEGRAADRLINFYRSSRGSVPPVEVALNFWTSEKERNLQALTDEVVRLRREVIENAEKDIIAARMFRFKDEDHHIEKVESPRFELPGVEKMKSAFASEKAALIAEMDSRMLTQKAEFNRTRNDDATKAAQALADANRSKLIELEKCKESSDKEKAALVVDHKRTVDSLKKEISDLKRKIAQGIDAEKKSVGTKTPTPPGSARSEKQDEDKSERLIAELRQRVEIAEGESRRLQRVLDVDAKYELESERLLVAHLQEEKRDLLAQLQASNVKPTSKDAEVVQLSLSLRMKEDEVHKLQNQMRDAQKELLVTKNKALELEFDKVALEGKFSKVASLPGTDRPARNTSNQDAVYELEKIILTLRQENRKLQGELTKFSESKPPRFSTSKASVSETKRLQELLAANATLTKQLEDAHKQHKADKEVIMEAEKILAAVQATELKYAAVTKENEMLKKEVASLNDDQFWSDLEKLQKKNKEMADALSKVAPQLLQEIELGN